MIEVGIILEFLFLNFFILILDPENLSVIKGSNEYAHTINAVQYSDAILPCRPTAPNVDVELWDASDNQIVSFAYELKA